MRLRLGGGDKNQGLRAMEPMGPLRASVTSASSVRRTPSDPLPSRTGEFVIIRPCTPCVTPELSAACWPCCWCCCCLRRPWAPCTVSPTPSPWKVLPLMSSVRPPIRFKHSGAITAMARIAACLIKRVPIWLSFPPGRYRLQYPHSSGRVRYYKRDSPYLSVSTWLTGHLLHCTDVLSVCKLSTLQT